MACVSTPNLGGLRKIFNLQPLRLFLVAPETTYTVWFVSAMANVFTNFMILY